MSNQAKARRIAVLGTRAVGNYLITKKKKKRIKKGRQDTKNISKANPRLLSNFVKIILLTVIIQLLKIRLQKPLNTED